MGNNNNADESTNTVVEIVPEVEQQADLLTVTGYCLFCENVKFHVFTEGL
jgi:hypothetical protein